MSTATDRGTRGWLRRVWHARIEVGPLVVAYLVVHASLAVMRRALTAGLRDDWAGLLGYTVLLLGICAGAAWGLSSARARRGRGSAWTGT